MTILVEATREAVGRPDVFESLTGCEGASRPNASPPQRSVEHGVRDVRTLLGLWAIVVVGATIRCRGLTTGGLRTSDAWVAITSRVGLGSAWHMFANAPGYYLFERSWILLHPGSTWWGQLPALALGIASIPAIFALCRYFNFAPTIQLGAALVVSVSPVCIIFSTRYKEYGADFLMACLLLALSERAHRDPTSKNLRLLAVISVISFGISGSTLPMVIGVWMALALRTTRVDAERRRSIVRALSAVAAGCLAVDRVLYSHLSPYLNLFWSHNFFVFSSPGSFVDSLYHLLSGVYQGLGGATFPGALEFSLFTALLIYGAVRSASNLGPVLALCVALVACLARAIPLGTGRTDEVLYPALLLLLASGIQRGCSALSEQNIRRAWRLWTLGIIGFTFAFIFILGGIGTDNRYDATDVGPLAAEINHDMRPGDHIVVDSLLRYSWALYEDRSLHITLGPLWLPGFSVTSTRSDTFIVPSLPGEGDWSPASWNHQLNHYPRLWLVESSYIANPQAAQPLASDYYGDLYRAGWRPVVTLMSTGCKGVLLIKDAGAHTESA
jgi:hypothetical protein